MSPHDIRRVWRAARFVDRAPARLAALEARQARATAELEAALYGRADLALPGYRVTREPDGIHVEPVDVIPADQLALWRELMAER